MATAKAPTVSVTPRIMALAGSAASSPAGRLAAKLLEKVRIDPLGSLGRATLGVIVLTVAYNATLAQDTRHASPWFGDAAPVEVAEAKPPAPMAARSLADPVVFGLQSELMDLGLYEGTIDGIAGSRTRKAISDYERANGLPVTGKANEALLARVRLDGVRHLPRPSSRGAIPAPSAEATGSIEPSVDEGPSTVTLVQRALQASGVEIAADGLMGPNTRAAIEAWEEAKGLPIVGEPSEALLAEMRKAGLL